MTRNQAPATNRVTGPAVRVVAVMVAVLTGALFAAPPAQAHTSLTGATPGKGETVASPSQVKLTFADPVRFPGLVVLDTAKHHHEAGAPHAVDNTVTAQIAGILPAGVYTVGWRAVAPDGHPVTGDYRFTVKAPPAGSSTPPQDSPTPPQATAPTAGPAKPASGASWWWVGLAVAVAAAAAATFALVRRR